MNNLARTYFQSRYWGTMFERPDAGSQSHYERDSGTPAKGNC